MTSNTYRMAGTTTPEIALPAIPTTACSRVFRGGASRRKSFLGSSARGQRHSQPRPVRASRRAAHRREGADTLINKNWKVTDDPRQFTRRGIYMVVRRSLTLPFFETFNISQPVESHGRTATIPSLARRP